MIMKQKLLIVSAFAIAFAFVVWGFASSSSKFAKDEGDA
jgi:hypothetical protein